MQATLTQVKGSSSLPASVPSVVDVLSASVVEEPGAAVDVLVTPGSVVVLP